MIVPSRVGALSLCLIVAACDCGSSPAPTRCGVASECPGAGDLCIDGLCGPAEVDDASTFADAQGIDVVVEDAGPCRAIDAESTLEPSPVDIIVTIDNSGSMSEEATQVRQNMNNFARILAESGLDYRVVLISRPDGSQGVCIPEPLGTGAPDCLGGPEGRLLAIHEQVRSRDAPERMLARYPDFVDFLRPEAVKVFIWITDDEMNTHTPDGFRADLAALEPAGMFDRTIHNSIVGFYGETPSTWGTRAAGDCGSLARVGAHYMRLAQCLTNTNEPIEDCTPGRTARVCELDWRPIFESIAEGVIAGVPVQCEFDLPAPPDGMELNLEDVRVTYERGDATREDLERTTGADACADGRWYFDDPAAPTEILLCPELCRRVQRDDGARMEVGLGCFPSLL
ncbi:MAG: hypothetical protein KF901_20425 [Myxococcales bacterium]|nr:hypothetical protein [Myxococcales bacterium]